MSDMIAGIYIPPEDNAAFCDCRDCKHLFESMHSEPCKRCINNGASIEKNITEYNWEPID